MSRETSNLPATRTWRDIPQPVVPRAMSQGGRWRLVLAALRVTAFLAAGIMIAWGIWVVAVSVRENTRAMPATAKATPMKRPELRTDGVLTDAWLVRTLALPKNTSLMELDLQHLRQRLLAEPQVLGATLTKNFPDRLVVQISERSPVARVVVQWLGQRHELLVARDGVIYAGEGYDSSVLKTLPYVSGADITPAGGGFRPIAGMEAAAELLARARIEAEHLYATWFSVSLARLQADHRIDVTTTDGRLIYFSTNDDFFRQLAKLDTIYDTLAARAPGAKATIDLTLGSDVPVTLIPAEPAPAASAAPSAARATLTAVRLPVFAAGGVPDRRAGQTHFLPPSSPSKREL